MGIKQKCTGTGVIMSGCFVCLCQRWGRGGQKEHQGNFVSNMAFEIKSELCLKLQ
jgi:hypothetical protein